MSFSRQSKCLKNDTICIRIKAYEITTTIGVSNYYVMNVRERIDDDKEEPMYF